MARLEIRDVTQYENAPQIRTQAVLIPRANSRVSANAIDVESWGIPRNQSAVAIEFVHAASVAARTPVTIRRPDVAAAHPHIVFAAKCPTILQMAPTAETLIHLHAVLS